jgi:hypothetical protein
LTFLEPHITSKIRTNFTLALGNSNNTASWAEQFWLLNSTDTKIPTLQIGFASSAVWEEGSNGSLIGLSTAPDRTKVADVDSSSPNFVIAASLASAAKTNKIVEVQSQNTSFWNVDYDIVVAFCSQVLEAVDTDIVLIWPNMTISSAHPQFQMSKRHD